MVKGQAYHLYNQGNYVFRLHDTGTQNNVIKWVHRCIDSTGA